MMVRPPRNPRQTASFAAGVMVLISGIFGLVYGNQILFWDTFSTEWDLPTDQEVTLVNTGALFAGIAYVTGFALSVVSGYCALRLTRYQLAVAGPVALIVAYFSSLAYEPWLLVVGVEVLVLCVVSLGLLYYAIPIYEGRATPSPLPPLEDAKPPGGRGPES
jgi:hypothetical protein